MERSNAFDIFVFSVKIKGNFLKTPIPIMDSFRNISKKSNQLGFAGFSGRFTRV